MKIVITGGPSAGKTALLDILALSFSHEVVIVQDAALILFRGGFPRYQDDKHLCCQQKAIYLLQRELENMAELDPMHRVLLCDRGSLDGLAYWPGDDGEFFAAIGSTMEDELKRYDYVFHVDTVQPINHKPNHFRIESQEKAMELNDRVRHAWRLHPNLIIVPSEIDFMGKIQFMQKTLRKILGETRASLVCDPQVHPTV